MKEISSTEAKTHFGALLDRAQREPVAIHKKGRVVAVMLSMQDFAEHEAMKLTLLQRLLMPDWHPGPATARLQRLSRKLKRTPSLKRPMGTPNAATATHLSLHPPGGSRPQRHLPLLREGEGKCRQNAMRANYSSASQ